MAYATKNLAETLPDGAHYYVRIVQEDAGTAELSALLSKIPVQGKIVRWRCVADGGTILPRLLMGSAAALEPAGGWRDVMQMPGAAAASFDAFDLGCYDLHGRPEAKIQSQGVGANRQIVHELWIRAGWR